jgi:hypothetical protein
MGKCNNYKEKSAGAQRTSGESLSLITWVRNDWQSPPRTAVGVPAGVPLRGGQSRTVAGKVLTAVSTVRRFVEVSSSNLSRKAE